MTTIPSLPWLARAKARLKALGITQQELIKPLGVETRGAIGHYLTGRREMSPEQLRALAKICRWTVDELLNNPPSPPPATAAFDDLFSNLERGVSANNTALHISATEPPRPHYNIDGEPPMPEAPRAVAPDADIRSLLTLIRNAHDAGRLTPADIRTLRHLVNRLAATDATA